MDGSRIDSKGCSVGFSRGCSSIVLFSRSNYIYEDNMKIIYATLFGCFIAFGSKVCYAQIPSWDNSPYNWKNSELNINNSSLKWDNSPYNWNNSELNINSKTGVYDNSGNRLGYETISPIGTTNYFDNDGNRRGYRGNND
jgi:hypothetical protein